MAKSLTPELLKSLTREQKLKLLDLVEEKQKRLKLALYAPHSGQRLVHNSKSLSRFVFAGNGSGKTALGVNELIWAVKGKNLVTGESTQVPCRAFVILDKPDKIENVLIPELRKWMDLRPGQLHKRGKPYISLITLDNGSTIKPIFWDQEPMTAEGFEGDFFWFDEPPPRALYISLRRAGRTKGRIARYLITGTPISAPWLRTEVYEPWSKGELPDVECFRFPTEMNRSNLADDYIETFSRVLSEKERAIRLEGEFFDLEGLALAHLFKRDIHVLKRSEYEFDRSKPCVVAIDPHPSKKHVAALVGIDEYGPVYLKEMALKVTPREFARSLKAFYKDYRVLDIVCDDLGSAEMTGGEGFKTFIQVLQDEGIRVRATRWKDKHDEDWISRLQDALQVPEKPDNFGDRIPKLRVLEGCTGIVADIETVQWAKYRNLEEYKPTLDIGPKDYLACLKYALACNLSTTKHKEKVYYVTKKVYGVKVMPQFQRRRTARR